ncbi:MAG: PstS family phosphate ABC transporter substrate-binding protein [Fibrobacterota bacterium]
MAALRTMFCVVFCVSMFYSCSTQDQSIRVKGSSTVLPIAQKTAEVFMNDHSEYDVIVEGGGSGVGIAALLDKTTDIANASRKIKTKEIKRFESAGIEPKVHVVGKDALTVIVHPSNKVQNLTLEQIDAIFRGIIKNWKEVGGKDLEIVPIARESSSGTYEFFKKIALNKKEYTKTCLASSSNGAMVKSVSQTEGAIGYAGLAYVNESIKAVNIQKEDGEIIEPTFENATNESYPLVRGLYMITAGEPTGLAKTYLDFVFSEKGQELVKKVGYIPVK